MGTGQFASAMGSPKCLIGGTSKIDGIAGQERYTKKSRGVSVGGRKKLMVSIERSLDESGYAQEIFTPLMGPCVAMYENIKETCWREG
jgi:hypothetical protein